MNAPSMHSVTSHLKVSLRSSKNDEVISTELADVTGRSQRQRERHRGWQNGVWWRDCRRRLNRRRERALPWAMPESTQGGEDRATKTDLGQNATQEIGK